MMRYRQRWIMYLSDTNTYFLWVDGRRDSVDDGSRTSQMRSHTNCGCTDNGPVSAMDSAPLRRDHILPVGGQVTRQR